MEGTGYPYKGRSSKIWALLHFVSGSLLRTQWTCVFRYFCSNHWSEQPTLHWDLKPSPPIQCDCYWLFTFFDLKSCCHQMIHHSDYETTVFWEVSLFLAIPWNLLARGWGLFAHLFQVILWDFIGKGSLVLLLPEATYVGISDFPAGLSRRLLYLCGLRLSCGQNRVFLLWGRGVGTKAGVPAGLHCSCSMRKELLTSFVGFRVFSFYLKPAFRSYRLCAPVLFKRTFCPSEMLGSKTKEASLGWGNKRWVQNAHLIFWNSRL